MRAIIELGCVLIIACACSVFIEAAPLEEQLENLTEPDIITTTTTTTTITEVDNDPEYTSEYYEGDIILAHHRTGLSDPTRRWPNNIVYYRIDGVFDQTQHGQIRMAMNRIEQATCIRFLPASWQTPNYVYINGRTLGCGSEVGYRGGFQMMHLQIDRPGNGCFRFGTILHELMHTLGVVHQQSAPDRDDYIKIFPENIRESNLVNFEKSSPFEVSNFGVPYDYYSVMHYSSYAFSKNGQKTIVALRDPNIVMGQRNDMTASDILKLNRMYNCR